MVPQVNGKGMTIGQTVPLVISQWQPSQNDKEGNKDIVYRVWDHNFPLTISNNQEEVMYSHSIILFLMIQLGYGNPQNDHPFQIYSHMKSHCQIIDRVRTNL